MIGVVGGRKAGIALLFVWLGAWIPLLPVVAGARIPIPDDVFVSDLADCEWPLRVEAGRLLAAQGPSAWSADVSLGIALMPDPWAIPYAVLPPVTALGVQLGFVLSLAAAGSFLLARRHGASLPAAALAGIGYAWSGYFASQLRHPGTLVVVAWFPLALWLLEGAAAPGAPWRERAWWALWFALVFGIQAGGGFPQAAYYSALVYAALTLARMAAIARESPKDALIHGVAVLGTTALGAGMGLAGVLPLAAGGAVSDRAGGVTWEFASRFALWPPDVAGFFVPYPFGDIADLTYFGRGMFWEDHGYVGMFAGILAFAFVVAHLARGRERGFVGTFWMVTGTVALLVAFGAATPLYRFLFDWLPGMGAFRFPTRLMFVITLALVQLAAHGLDALLAASPGVVRWRWAIVGVCALDLAWFNARQVPLVDAAAFLENPTVDALRDRPPGRIYPRRAMARHMEAWLDARGWADTAPYLRLRPGLQPDSNLLYDLPTITGYVPIAPSGVVDLVGDHNRDGLLQRLDDHAAGAGQVLDLLDARYVVTEAGWPVGGALSSTRVGDLALIEREGAARVRVARSVVTLDIDGMEAAIRAGTLDLRVTAVLAPGVDAPPVTPGTSTATLVSDDGDGVVVDVDGDGPGILVVADALYPGWTATVDGADTPILLVDRGLRGIPVAGGSHRVALAWTDPAARMGIWASATAFAAWILALGVVWRPRAP